MNPTVYAVGPWVLVDLEPPPPASTMLYTPAPEDTVGWATVLHVGAAVREPLAEGTRVLVSRLAMVAIGEYYLVPQTGILLTEAV